jgi:hypothetical protein
VAVALQQHQRVGGEAQVEQRAVGPAAAQHLGVEGVAEAHQRAGLGDLLARRWAQHLVAGQHALDQRLDRAAGGLFAEQARLDDAGVVEHHQVAGLQQRGQVAEDAVHRRGAAAVEQPRGAAFGRGLLGDQLRRQHEVEIGNGEM